MNWIDFKNLLSTSRNIGRYENILLFDTQPFVITQCIFIMGQFVNPRNYIRNEVKPNKNMKAWNRDKTAMQSTTTH